MKNNIFKYIFIILFIGLIIFAIYTFYGKNKEDTVESSNTKENEQKILTNIRLGVANFDTINPILSNNQTIQNISKLVYEPLLKITKDFKIEECLAKEVSKVNATTYVVKLREDVKWNNKTDFLARDVQFTIDKLKAEGVGSIYANNVKNIIQLDVVDAHTLRIILNEEVPFFEYNLIFPIISYEDFEGEDFINTQKNIFPIGTGRFKIIENDEKRIVLAKNNEWWDIKDNATKLERIEIYKFATVTEKYNEFKAGNIDLMHTANINYEQYAGTIGYSIKEIPGKKTDFLAMNTRK